jgi:hypothetical protein
MRPGQVCLDCSATTFEGDDFNQIVHSTPHGNEYDIECGSCFSLNTETEWRPDERSNTESETSRQDLQAQGSSPGVRRES